MMMNFKEILDRNGIITHPISKVTVAGASNPGEGFAVVHEFLTVEFEDSAKEPLHLFVKRKTDKSAFNEMLDDWQTFQKEGQFFKEYLPMAREYCESVGQEKLMSIYPKCYYADENMTILKNLRMTRNLVVLDHEERRDFKAAAFALTNLALHHAISHSVICELGGGAEAFSRKFPHLVFQPLLLDNARELVSPTWERGIETSIKILEICPDVEGSSEALETLTSLRGKTFEKVMEGLEGNPGELNVLIHGDYWNNNMMFRKSSHTDQFEDQVILDFQEMKYASPCKDIAMYLFTSVQAKVRRENFRDLMEIYLSALKDTGNGLGHPIEISMKDLEESFCKHFHSGYFFGLSFSPLSQAAFKAANVNLNELEDMTEVQRKRKEVLGKWVEENPELCKEWVGQLIDYVRYYQQLSIGVVE